MRSDVVTWAKALVIIILEIADSQSSIAKCLRTMLIGYWLSSIRYFEHREAVGAGGFQACVLGTAHEHWPTVIMQQNVAELPLADQLWVWFEKNNKRVLWGAIVVVVVGLIVWFYMHGQSQKEIDAGEALSRQVAVNVLSDGMKSPSAEAYVKLANDYPGSQAAAQALLLAGERYFQDGKYAEAQTQFERFSREFQGNHAFAPQATYGRAVALEAQGKLDDAAKAYKECGDRFATVYSVGPNAKLAFGRISEAQGKLEIARGVYEDIARQYQFLPMARQAMQKARELELKGLTPPPQVIAPAPVPSEPTFRTTFTNVAPANANPTNK